MAGEIIRKFIIVWAVLSGGATFGGPGGAGEAGVEIEPDPYMQGEVDRIVMKMTAVGTEEEEMGVFRDIFHLKKKCDKSGPELVRQIIHAMAQVRGERGMYYLVLIGELRLNDSDLARGALPLLASPHEKVAEYAGMVLGWVEKNGIGQYGSMLQGAKIMKLPVPANLIERMLWRFGGEAVALLANHYGLDAEERKNLLLTERVVTDGLWKKRYGLRNHFVAEADELKALESLSKHARWWVRLYVVETMAANGEYGNPELWGRLAKDENPAVRKAVDAVLKKRAPAEQKVKD